MSEYRQDPAQELRDLADLEVLGLLDEIDQRQFECALGKVTVVEQDAIRERQAALVQRLVGEPMEELPEDLRERVCAAIRGEVELHEESLAPLARIGRRRRERVQQNDESTPGAVLGMRSMETLVEVSKIRRSAVIWRAASFALTASLIAAVFFMFQTVEWAKQADRIASQQGGHEELLQLYGHGLNDLLREDNNEEILGLATSVEQRGVVGVILNKNTNSVKLLTFGLKPDSYVIKYEVQGQDPVSVPFELEQGTGSTVIDLAQADAPPGFVQHLLSMQWRIENNEGNVVAVCNPKIA